jgi:hypothetical protein
MSHDDGIKELETAVHQAWRLLGKDGQEPNVVIGLLPAGGVECERSAEVARDTLGAVIGEEPGLRGIRTANNELAPNWTTSQCRWWGEPDAIARL